MRKVEIEWKYNHHLTIGKMSDGKFFAEFLTFRFEADSAQEVIDAVGAEMVKDFDEETES